MSSVHTDRDGGMVPTGQLRLSYDTVGPLIAVCDIVLIVASAVLSSVLYHYVRFDEVADQFPYVGVGIFASLAYALTAWNVGLYRFSTLLQTRRDYVAMFTVWVLIASLLLLSLFLFKLGSSLSRGSVVSFLTFGFGLLIVWRRVAKRMVRLALEAGVVRGRKVFVIGTAKELSMLRSSTLLEVFGLDEIARSVLVSREGDQPGIPDANETAFASAISQMQALAAEEVMVALPWGDHAFLDYVRTKLRVLPVPVKLIPDQYIRTIWAGQDAIKANSFLVDIQRPPLSRIELASKRVFDIVAATTALLLVFPLLAVIALLVKLESPGPIIFRQRRRGFNGQEFTIFKFRTMRVTEDGAEIVQAKRRDARVTPLGRILRRSSLDEFPQLLNVLRGDMSLVGPRPHAVAHDTKYGAIIGTYAFRHHVKPGITGWAQVNGFRGETPHVQSMANRIDYDLWYVNNWSLMLDFRILLRTCIDVCLGKNAY